VEWDGWPDGTFERLFTHAEADATQGLQVHWAMRRHGGDRKGDLFSKTVEGGKKSKRTCLGIIKCDNPDCQIVIRPQTRPDGIENQLQRGCTCAAALRHFECDVTSILVHWLGGVKFSNYGQHAHRRPAHILHLSRDESRRFKEIVAAHPTVGPLNLIVGIPGINGPGESVADISDAFLNAGRVGKERLKLKHGSDAGGGDSFIAAFAKFSKEHPGFIIGSRIDEVSVISVQSDFMRSLLLNDYILDEPINGMVNDATHSWWRERNYLLMVTSAYCPELSCWVPGVLSFTNGASADHFTYHFLAVFQGIAREADSRKLEVKDELFAGVCCHHPFMIHLHIHFTDIQLHR
jgi:hypothetical protein